MDLKLSDIRKMQQELREKHLNSWGALTPDRGMEHLLWGIGEIGEVIDIVKKRGAEEVMENPETRRHFIEEVCDVVMYLDDMLSCYKVSVEEYSEIHARKHAYNMKRDYAEQNAHLFDGK